MESLELVLCNKTERVTIFKIPPLSTTKGYYLDDWKQMIWEGGVKVTEKDKIIKISFVDKKGLIFGQTKVPNDYTQAIKKTNDSSRGYAVRLENPKGGFLWVGVAFRDRNDAFDFGVVFQESADKNNINSNSLNAEFGEKVDFSIKKGEKVKINLNSNSEGTDKTKKNSTSSNNAFDFDFNFNQPIQQSTKTAIHTDPNWFVGSFEAKQPPKQIVHKQFNQPKNENLIDFE